MLRNRIATAFLVVAVVCIAFLAGKIQSDQNAPAPAAAHNGATTTGSAPVIGLAPPVQVTPTAPAAASGTGSAGSGAPAPAPIVPFSLPYDSGISGSKNWVQNWGKFSPADVTASGIAGAANGAFNFGATASTASATGTTGGVAFLSGTNAWVNYDVETTVDWKGGESFGIIARMKNETNFLYCSFGDHYARIVLRSNGVDTAVGEGVAPNGGAGSSEQLGMRVYGNKAACAVAGKDVVTAVAANGPTAGGIGLLSWDPAAGVSDIVIKNVHAAAIASDNIVIAPPPPPAPTSTVADAATAPTNVVHPLPYSIGTFGDGFADGDDWLLWWGSAAQASGVMTVGANASSTGGGAWLNGSADWNDYTMQANVDWVKGQSFGIVAQYVDGKNYVLCNFSEPVVGSVYMSLRQYVDGKEIDLASGRVMNYNSMGGGNLNVALSVNGAQSACGFNGHAISTVVAATAVSPAGKGGIAFTTWDPALNNSEIIVHSVGVSKGALNLGSYDSQEK